MPDELRAEKIEQLNWVLEFEVKRKTSTKNVEL